ncbi:hypothetical protein EJ02DRAFT_106780 [Clathrospora elynae]|uniref:L domain-like protein n=1 Tax=Clathrospora elynae TaxID=706981 RepID=A0A6A5SBZ6_9PLEO|nr:hypothetical protein EJ02DRAFT_106780 [Clathrospora elynae]
MDDDAIPPSSPPLANPPSSPFPEPVFTFKSSSPAPVFSTDDSQESVGLSNYESPRIFKNKRRCTWWASRESANTTPELKKTKIARNFDSGVYMLSDSTDNSDDVPPQHIPPFPPHQLRLPFGIYHDQSANTSAAETAFNHQLDNGLDRDLQVYDFQELNLEDSDIHRISHLAEVIRPFTAGEYRSLVPELSVHLSQNKLHRLVPPLFSLQHLTSLFLRRNDIKELPSQIGRLQNLVTLDVSLNKLTHLPFEIVRLLQPHGKLERLTAMGNPFFEPMPAERFHKSDYVRPDPEDEGALHDRDALPLDLLREDAANQLRHLYGSLALSKDRDQAVWRIRYFESWANSFDGGDDARECAAEQDDGFYVHHPSLDLDAVQASAPRYIARTLVSYFDQTGNPCHGSPSLPSSRHDAYPVILETNQGTYGAPSSPWFAVLSTSSTASLVTTSLHVCLKNGNTVHELRETFKGYPVPYDAEAIFTRAEENDVGGYGYFRDCHVCGKKYVVARAEWIEFWSKGLGIFFPVKVKVCSWRCVPAEMVNRPSKHLTW